MPPIDPDLHPAAEFRSEVADINREFLRLLTHPDQQEAQAVLGLEKPVLDSLRRLDAAALDALASLPLLLPEFRPFPSCTGVREPLPMPTESDLSPAWNELRGGFANRLLTCIWQLSRQNVWRTSLCAGIARADGRRLAEMSFRELSRCTEQAAGLLRVRLAGHPLYWPELIRVLRHGDDEQQIASRFAVIPLSIAQRWHAGVEREAGVYL
jgi:hypothetical protein